jgi:hypothetical protein
MRGEFDRRIAQLFGQKIFLGNWNDARDSRDWFAIKTNQEIDERNTNKSANYKR